MKRDALLQQVKQTVHEIEPDADIILYGSRARGDARAESDWDFLILLDGVVDDKRTDAIRVQCNDTEIVIVTADRRIRDRAKSTNRVATRWSQNLCCSMAISCKNRCYADPDNPD